VLQTLTMTKGILIDFTRISVVTPGDCHKPSLCSAFHSSLLRLTQSYMRSEQLFNCSRNSPIFDKPTHSILLLLNPAHVAYPGGDECNPHTLKFLRFSFHILLSSFRKKFEEAYEITSLSVYRYTYSVNILHQLLTAWTILRETRYVFHET
jgi:hypothetical protein